MPFIKEMDKAYTAADIVVSRAGAIAISELCISGKPAILVPSPNVAEDHQTKNALSLTGKDAAMLIRDENANEELMPAIVGLLSDHERIKILADNISKFAKPDATENIVREIIKLIND